MLVDLINDIYMIMKQGNGLDAMVAVIGALDVNEPMSFVSDWLGHHIKAEDRQDVPFVKQIL